MSKAVSSTYTSNLPLSSSEQNRIEPGEAMVRKRKEIKELAENIERQSAENSESIKEVSKNVEQNNSVLAGFSTFLDEEQSGHEVAVVNNEQDWRDEKIQQLEAKIKDQERLIEEKDREMKEKDLQNKQLQAELDKEKKEKDLQNTKLQAELNKVKKEKDLQNRKLQAELDKVKESCDMLRSEKANVVDILKQHTKRIQQLESEVQKTRRMNVAWKKGFEELVTKKESLEYILRRLNEIIVQICLAVRSLNNENAALRSENSQLNCDIAAMRRQYELDSTVIAVEACVQCGYDREIVLEAKQDFERRYGHVCCHAEDLMTMIFELEEQGQ